MKLEKEGELEADQLPLLRFSFSSEAFNHSNGLTLVARAHQLVMEGYSWAQDVSFSSFNSGPQLAFLLPANLNPLEAHPLSVCFLLAFDRKTSSPSSLHPTTATDVETRLLSSRSTMLSSTPCASPLFLSPSSRSSTRADFFLLPLFVRSFV